MCRSASAVLDVPAQDCASLYSDKNHVIKFMDSREVYLVTSHHSNTTNKKRRGRILAKFNQPVVSIDYNYYMGAWTHRTS